MSDTTSYPNSPPLEGWREAPGWSSFVGVRSAVTRTVLLFAACVLVMQILGGVIGVVIAFMNPAVADVLRQHISSGNADVSAIVSDPVFQQALGPATLIGSIIGEALGICCFFGLRGKRLLTSDIATTHPVGRRWGQLGAAVAAIFAIQLVLGLLNALVGLTGYDPSNVQSTLLDPVLNSVWGMLAAIFVLPFFEELIFRGAIMRHLVPYGVNFAIVTQAVLFGLWHMNLYQGIFAVPMGLILGFVAYRFSLKWSFALHALNNGFAMVMGLSWMPGWVAPAIMVVAALAALAVVVLHRDRIGPFVAAGAPPRPAPTWVAPGQAIRMEIQPSPFRIGWASPAFIVVTAIMFLVCCLMMQIA